MTIIRKCQSCKKNQNRDNMFKITKTKDGLVFEPSSKELGRSMYVCKNLDCIKILIKKHKIKNALKCTNLDEVSKIEQILLEYFKEQNV